MGRTLAVAALFLALASGTAKDVRQDYDDIRLCQATAFWEFWLVHDVTKPENSMSYGESVMLGRQGVVLGKQLGMTAKDVAADLRTAREGYARKYQAKATTDSGADLFKSNRRYCHGKSLL
ncbi:MAG TPA: hypothetical protein VGF56_12800 [Rhizomicrobium sp.]|jgi:hypothetical protein